MCYLRSTVARQKLKELGGISYSQWNMMLNAIMHVKPYHILHVFGYCWGDSMRLDTKQVLHSCRQFVTWVLWLIPWTNVTYMVASPAERVCDQISSDKGEEGRRSQVRMTLMMWAAVVLQWDYDREWRMGNYERVFKLFLSTDCGLKPSTWSWNWE